MFCIGIDPSYSCTGIVALDANDAGALFEMVKAPKGENEHDRRVFIVEGVLRFLDAVGPVHCVAIEAPHAGASGRTTVMLSALYGVLTYALVSTGRRLFVVQPSDVRKYVCANGTAKKDEVRLRVWQRWKFEHPSTDVVDAYAIAQLARAVSTDLVVSNKSQLAAVAAIRNRVAVPL